MARRTQGGVDLRSTSDARGERSSRGGRAPTPDELTARQRTLYDALPAEMRLEYLDQLPKIIPMPDTARKRVTLLEERFGLVEGIIEGLRDYQRELRDIITATQEGHPSAREVDLRKLLAPPEIPGVSLRFTRGSGRKR